MEVKAKIKYLRISPRKVRLVVDVVRGLSVEEALSRLAVINKRAVRPVVKLINSAIANAENNFKLKREDLFIKFFTVDEGPTLKRWRARAFGRAAMIRKRTSHLNLILSDGKDETDSVDSSKEKAELKDKASVKTEEEKGIEIIEKDSVKKSENKKVVKDEKDETAKVLKEKKSKK